MRKLLLTLVGINLVLAATAQQAQAPVDITSEPHHHLALENMFVRVFAVSVDPQATTLMHRHPHDYLSIAIGDSQITNTREGVAPANVSFKDGDVRFAAAGIVHAVADAGTTQFRNATIELLGPTTNQKACTESCAIPVPCASADKAACPSVVKVFGADQWSVTLITLPPGATWGQHTHLANFLVLPLTDSEATIKNQDQPQTVAHYKTGEVTWNNPVVHSVTNSGKTTSRSIVLEFRGRPAGEGSESMGPGDAPKDAKPHDHF